jgi:tetratricopeptide (TPR) repeat protein
MSRAEISRFWSDRARVFIREQPRAWLKIMAMKFGKFWSGNEYDDLGILTNYREHGVIFGFLTFGMIATLGVPAAFFAVRESKRALWIVAAVLLHMAALMPVFVTERYRLAAAPGLILLSAFAVFWCWEKIGARCWKPLAAYIALALPVACWAMMPQSGTGIAELDDYNRGLLAMRSNDLDRAEPLLMKAYIKFPQNPDVNAALGLLALKRGNHAVAKKFLRFAVEHDPQNAGAWQNLAIIAIMENRTDIAANFLERAVAASPDDAGAFMLLAKTRKQNGDIAGALAAVESALRLDPARTEAIQLKAELERQQSATPQK